MKENILSNQLILRVCASLIQCMKRSNCYHCVLLIATLALTALSGCESTGTAGSAGTATAAPAAQGGAQLVIRRAPNMGTNLFLDVSIDGAHAGVLAEGETFRRSLSPGNHVVSVLLRPNQLNLSPTKKTLTVTKGQTYTLTAMWKGETVVLL